MLINKKESRQISRAHFDAIRIYINSHLEPECYSCAMPRATPPEPAKKVRSAPKADGSALLPCEKAMPAERPAPSESVPPEQSTQAPRAVFSAPVAGISSEDALEEYLRTVKDESFTEMLLRKIDEKGMSDADCYKKANIDKRLFSKIRSNPLYKPSKSTALALILALELPYGEAVEMLHKAGYALSRASKADLIVEYYLRQGIYDIFVINNSLYDFDQPLIAYK